MKISHREIEDDNLKLVRKIAKVELELQKLKEKKNKM
jgi:hypothetical protein